jgi:hypothetical protein
MGARVYDPYTGTFLQTDPIPGADANAYGYTDGDPVNETDLSGDMSVWGAGGRIICAGLACLGIARGEPDVPVERPSGRASGGQVVGKGGGQGASKSPPAPPPNNETSTRPGARIRYSPPTGSVGPEGTADSSAISGNDVKTVTLWGILGGAAAWAVQNVRAAWSAIPNIPPGD